MKRAVVLLCAVAAIQGAIGQIRFDPLGLSGRAVYDLAEWGGKIYAATDDGVYVRMLELAAETTWTPCGLQGKRVRAVYPHQSGAVGYALTAGIEHRAGDEDSTVIYCSQNSDSAWQAADQGINHSLVRMIGSIDGFPSPAICGETYAASEGLVFRRQIGGVWEKVFDLGIAVTNVVRVCEPTAAVWVGGETTILAPFISRSDDKGDSWMTAYPDLQGDNACDALAFDPSDTSIAYAGMEGSVIVSRDGGKNWEVSGLSGTPFYFFGLEVTAATRRIFAGGAAHGGRAGLYAKDLDGSAWVEYTPPQSMRGILTMLPLTTAGLEDRLLLGTDGSGVVCFSISPCAVSDYPAAPGVLLCQNYPNPFNAATTIRYTLPRAGNATVSVYDLLGREIATLISGGHEPGEYSTLWDARGQASGGYLVRLSVDARTTSTVMLLVR